MTGSRNVVIRLGICVSILAAVLLSWIWYSGSQRTARNREKLLAKWNLISGGAGGTMIQFFDSGRLTLSRKRKLEVETHDGYYRLNGNKLEMTALVVHRQEMDWKDVETKSGDSPQSPVQEKDPTEPEESLEQIMTTITSLTDRELIVRDGSGRKTAYAKVP